MRVKVDVGGATWLAVCPCGWRGLPALDRSEALREARHHELRAHPGDQGVVRQMQETRRLAR